MIFLYSYSNELSYFLADLTMFRTQRHYVLFLKLKNFRSSFGNSTFIIIFKIKDLPLKRVFKTATKKERLKASMDRTIVY